MRGGVGRGPMIRPWPNRQTPLRVGRYLSTLAAQFLQACSDRREIIGGTGAGSPGAVPPFVLGWSRNHRGANGTKLPAF
jgi:hypothetical protein